MPVTIHLGGTPRDLLVQQQLDISDACIDVISALQNAAPHGRDYPFGINDKSRVSDTQTIKRDIENIVAIMGRVNALAANYIDQN